MTNKMGSSRGLSPRSAQNLATLFAKELNKPEPALDRLALYISQIRYPDLDIDENLALLDELSEPFIDALESCAPGYERAHCFLTIFNDILDFEGNIENYYHADNSFLNRVLTRRAGLPILLSLVCVAIGDRMRRADMDIDIQGVGLPSHFMVRYVDVAGIWLLDPFYGKVLPPEDAATYLTSLFTDHLSGKIIELPANTLRPVSTQMMLYRLLNNLRMLYINDADYKMALHVLGFMLKITPNDTQLWKERGLLNHHCQYFEQASRDLRRYFFLRGHWLIASGIVPGADPEFDMPSGFLLDVGLLDEYGDEYLSDDYLSDDLATDESSTENLTARRDDDAVGDLHSDNHIDRHSDSHNESVADDSMTKDEFDRGFDYDIDDELDDDLDEYEYVELSDEEYYLLNILTDIEETRLQLN